jgi:hypothetical protein
MTTEDGRHGIAYVHMITSELKIILDHVMHQVNRILDIEKQLLTPPVDTVPGGVFLFVIHDQR